LLPLAPHLVRHVPAVVAKDALRHNWQSYSRTLRNVIFEADTQRWLQQTAAPVLLIHGTRDKTAPYENVRHYAHLPNVQLLTLEADHGLIFTHGSLIASELAQFFAQRGSGTA
jgi:pimeloyl-ACP methyl ester carboxylesterase